MLPAAMSTCSVAVTLLLMTSSCAGYSVIDLTYQLKENESIGWPIYPEYNFTILTRGYTPLAPGVWLESNKFDMAEHTGTHMDAPAHFAKDHWRMNQIPASRLVGPGVVVDVTQKANSNHDYAITVADLQAWETKHGRIPDGAVILMNSGWGSRYPHKERVFNTADPSNSSTYHFPGFSGAAVTWLAENRIITALGGDTPSPDVGNDPNFPVHAILLGRDILILENVGQMHLMPVTGTLVVMGALNIHDGSGAPMRLMALEGLQSYFKEQDDDSNHGRVIIPAIVLIITPAVILGRMIG